MSAAANCSRCDGTSKVDHAGLGMDACDHGEAEVLEKTGTAIAAVQEMLAAMKSFPPVDARSLAVARTQFETAFLWVANATESGGLFDALDPENRA